MDTSFPTGAQVRAMLSRLSIKQIDQLAELSGVPAPTITKIKYGQTTNPGIDTVGRMLPFLGRVVGVAGATSAS